MGIIQWLTRNGDTPVDILFHGHCWWIIQWICCLIDKSKVVFTCWWSCWCHVDGCGIYQTQYQHHTIAYVLRSKYGIWFMVIHPSNGYSTYKYLYILINGLMIIPKIWVYNPTFDSTLAWTQRSIMTQPPLWWWGQCIWNYGDWYREDQEKTGANKSNFWQWNIFTVTITWAYKRDHNHQHHHQYDDDHNDHHNIIRMIFL